MQDDLPEFLTVCEAAARAGGRVLCDWIGRFGIANKGPRDLVTEADLASQQEIRRIVLGAFPEHDFIGEESLDQQASTASASRDAAGLRWMGLRWMVDPLDGTSNYVHGYPAYCVSVALARGDSVLVGTIYDPVRGECFTASAGGGAFLNGQPIRVAQTRAIADALVAVSFPPHVSVDSISVADFLAVLPQVHSVRRTGSTAINLAYLACGRLDAFWVRSIACWDVAAGLLMVQESGGAIGPFGTPCNATATALSLDKPAFIAACSAELLGTLQQLLTGIPSVPPED